MFAAYLEVHSNPGWTDGREITEVRSFSDIEAMQDYRVVEAAVTSVIDDSKVTAESFSEGANMVSVLSSCRGPAARLTV